MKAELSVSPLQTIAKWRPLLKSWFWSAFFVLLLVLPIKRLIWLKLKKLNHHCWIIWTNGEYFLLFVSFVIIFYLGTVSFLPGHSWFGRVYQNHLKNGKSQKRKHHLIWTTKCSNLCLDCNLYQIDVYKCVIHIVN